MPKLFLELSWNFPGILLELYWNSTGIPLLNLI